MSAQREEFEAWAAEEGFRVSRLTCLPDAYIDISTSDAWRSWRAAQAAMQAKDAARYQWMRQEYRAIDAEGAKLDKLIDAEIARNAKATP